MFWSRVRTATASRSILAAARVAGPRTEWFANRTDRGASFRTAAGGDPGGRFLKARSRVVADAPQAPGTTSRVEPLHTGNAVEPGIEAHDALNLVSLHHGQVNRVTRGQGWIAENDCAGLSDASGVD